MATNTLSMLALGRLIIAALSAVTSKCTLAARDAFTKAYLALVEAEATVKSAERSVALAAQAVRAADEAQDRATLDLATKMSGDGFGRLNPFKAFGVVNPSRLVIQGHVAQANVLIALAEHVSAHPDASPQTKKAVAVVDRAARAVKKTENTRQAAVKRRADAIHARDASLPNAFSTALADLRAAIRYSDYLEKTAHYPEVFGGLRKVRAKKSRPAVQDPVI